MLSKEEAKKLSAGYNIIPIYMEMFSDVTTPIEVLKKLKKKQKLLHPGKCGKRRGRRKTLQPLHLPWV